VGSQHDDVYGLDMGSEPVIELSHEDTNGANNGTSFTNRLLGGIMKIRGGDWRTEDAGTVMGMNILSCEER
jgi:hypothetical protein